MDPKPERKPGARKKEGIHGVPYCSLSVVDQGVETPLIAEDALEANDTAQMSTTSTNAASVRDFVMQYFSSLIDSQDSRRTGEISRDHV